MTAMLGLSAHTQRRCGDGVVVCICLCNSYYHKRCKMAEPTKMPFEVRLALAKEPLVRWDAP